MTTVNADALFNACVSDIENAYKRLGHQLGWRFLGVPKAVLRSPIKLALIALHPGGNHEPEDHPRASCEAGNWYTSESWAGSSPGTSRLQQQVRRMFRAIGEETDFRGESDLLISQSLVSNLVPFRSPSLALLPKRDESFEFAHSLWAKVLPQTRPKLIVCLGRDAQKALQKLIPDSLGLSCTQTKTFPTGWGALTASLQTFEEGTNQMRLLALPHLSRFTVFTSGQCAIPMKSIMKDACKGL